MVGRNMLAFSPWTTSGGLCSKPQLPTSYRIDSPPCRPPKLPSHRRARGAPALPPDLVDGTGDEALDIRPVLEDLREGAAEGGSGLDGGKADLP